MMNGEFSQKDWVLGLVQKALLYSLGIAITIIAYSILMISIVKEIGMRQIHRF